MILLGYVTCHIRHEAKNRLNSETALCHSEFFCLPASCLKVNIMWHIDPLLGNDREISSCTTVFAR
jgi:hypothetical protein